MHLTLLVLNRAPKLHSRTSFIHPTGAGLHMLPRDSPAFPTPPALGNPKSSVSFVDRFICVMF